MTNRRVDAIYFLVFLAIVAVGWGLSNRPTDEEASLPLPDFQPLELSLEVPFEIPYQMVKFKSRVAPQLRLSGDIETVLVENRRVLLKGSGQVAVRPVEHLAALIE